MLWAYAVGMKSKVQENKKQKMDRLVASASRLFTETGVEKVSVEEIARQAGVAKGTFYLYFHDKEQLRDLIISREAARLFETADECLRTSPQASFVDAVLFMIDNVLSQLEARATLLKFIRRSLTFAVFHENISGLMQEEQFALYPRFLDLAQSYGWQLKNPYKTLFLVVELASGTCYSCLIDSKPCSMEDMKPVLYSSIRAILESAKKPVQPPAARISEAASLADANANMA